MSLKIIQHSDSLEILEGSLPLDQPVKVFTEEEVLQFEGWKQWMSLSDEQREDMMLQTQSAAFKEWMDDDDWEECSVGEDPADYGKSSFQA